MKPLRNNVIVAQRKKENKTESGILLTKSIEGASSMTGIVVEIGPDVKDIAVGNEVVPDWGKGRSIQVGDIQAVVLEDKDILAIIEG